MHTPDQGPPQPDPAGPQGQTPAQPQDRQATPSQPAYQQEYRVPAAPPSYAGPQPPAAPPRRKGWVTGVIAAVVVLALLGCCAMPVVFLAVGGFGSSDIYSNGIAVIHIDGVVAGTASADPLFGGGEVTPEYIIQLLQAADEDPGIEAIVLRIDSPGGTAAASQEIATEVGRVRKPVIASVGDVAASGAYWIAAQCDMIIANPSSTVGSIGVIMQIPNYEGLLEKIGVEYTVLTKGEFKDAGSPFRSLNTTELAMLDEDLEIVYQQFIEGVADGRGMEVEDVEELATGWAWTAQTGQELGLVDELGTYQDAIDAAAEEAGLGSYEVIYYDEASPWDILFWLLTAEGGFDPFGTGPLRGAEAPPVAR